MAKEKVDEKSVESSGDEIKSTMITDKLQSKLFIETPSKEKSFIETPEEKILSVEKSQNNLVKAEFKKSLTHMQDVIHKDAKEHLNGQVIQSTASSSSKMVRLTIPPAVKPSVAKSAVTKSPTVKPATTIKIPVKKVDESVRKIDSKVPKITTTTVGTGNVIPSTFTGDDEDDYFHGFVTLSFHFSFYQFNNFRKKNRFTENVLK